MREQTGRMAILPRKSADADSVAYFSSSGPTADGRFKPDLVAPGAAVVSARSDGYSGASTCKVHSRQGTSAAAPLAAGSAALLRQARAKPTTTFSSSTPPRTNFSQQRINAEPLS